MQPFLQQTYETWRTWLADHGLPKYRAGQVWRWVFQKRATDFDQMTDLPKALREELAQHFRLFASREVAYSTSDDGTAKLLLELSDGQRIECVLLRDNKGNCTACVSTQVGCAMRCAFCATGLDGVVRNLTSGEIVEQMLQLQQHLTDEERLGNLVIMGMGEPLANLDGLLPALDTVTTDEGLAIGKRRVTISTVGLPPGIRRLTDHGSPYHLAISLHATEDRLRDELIPANRKYDIASVLEAADYYFEQTGRRVTYEYVLLSGVNDADEDARRLVSLLRGRTAWVNLIPYNPVPGLPYRTPSLATTARFGAILNEGGLTVRTRHRKGDRIDAACGQLRRVKS